MQRGGRGLHYAWIRSYQVRKGVEKHMQRGRRGLHHAWIRSYQVGVGEEGEGQS